MEAAGPSGTLVVAGLQSVATQTNMRNVSDYFISQRLTHINSVCPKLRSCMYLPRDSTCVRTTTCILHLNSKEGRDESQSVWIQTAKFICLCLFTLLFVFPLRFLCLFLSFPMTISTDRVLYLLLLLKWKNAPKFNEYSEQGKRRFHQASGSKCHATRLMALQWPEK